MSGFKRLYQGRGRLIAVLGLIFILIVACISVFYWIPREIQKRWQRIEDRLAAENIDTDFWALQKPPLPAEGNFFNIPELIDLPLEPTEPLTKLMLKSKRDDLIKLSEGLQKSSPSAGIAKGEKLDLLKSAQELVISGVLKTQPALGREAQAIRAGLETRPLLLTLSKQAALSTHAEFIPAISLRPRPKMLVEMKVPHLDAMSRTARPLALHGVVCSELGDVDAALRDFRAMQFIATDCQDEGTFISSLVGVTIWAQAMSIPRSIFERRQFSTEQLQQIEAWLMEVNHQAALLHAAKSELATGLQVIDFMLKNPQKNFGSSSSTKKSFSSFQALGPWFLKLNKNVYAELMTNGFVLPLKNGGFPEARNKAKEIDAALKITGPKPLHLDKVFAMLMMPTAETITCMYVHTEVERRQALTACALERFFLQYRRYPNTLAELPVPPPNDPLTDRAFSYRLTPSGRYQIWAFGFDGKDDGGKVMLPPDGKNPAPSNATFLGDWTWSYETVAK
jgi:hypothetical protein